ncbi:hypothetical protein PACTADRAFT_30749, partial [Pachysolen tannophilus NRRL Y-2460]
ISSNGNMVTNSRSIIFHDLPENVTLSKLLDNVNYGPVENCHFLKDENNSQNKSIVISFLEQKTAASFFKQISNNHKLAISLNAPNLKISWTLSNSISPIVKSAIENDSATRNVYIGNLPSHITEEFLKEELGNYGIIESIDFIADKKIAFVHFTNIASAIKAVDQLPLDSVWSNCKIFYGKDRCSKNQARNNTNINNNGNSNTNNNFNGNGNITNNNYNTDSYFPGMNDNNILNSTLSQNTQAAAALATTVGGASNVGNRTVYLGNLHPNTTCEEICNIVRGGLLQSIKLLKEKHFCFLTFIDPLAAAQFYASTNMDSLIIHNRKLKVGWGKHSGKLPNQIALAVTAGASRNVYIGVTEQFSDLRVPDEETLRQDFSEFGEIEQINFFKDGFCAFVNFLNITSAIKVVDEFKKKNNEHFQKRFNDRYAKYKISFGKDRCGNPPK